MTQRTGDFIRGTNLPIFELATGLYVYFTFNLFSALIVGAALAAFSLVINFIVVFKTVTVKSVKMLEARSEPDKIKGTIEDMLISEVCKYASEKHLNPSIDIQKNGLFLNANKDNTIIGVCELGVPNPNTKYLSDDYKHCYDLNIEAIDKFVSQHPEFSKGE
jgi:hypothetical protein